MKISRKLKMKMPSAASITWMVVVIAVAYTLGLVSYGKVKPIADAFYTKYWLPFYYEYLYPRAREETRRAQGNSNQQVHPKSASHQPMVSSSSGRRAPATHFATPQQDYSDEIFYRPYTETISFSLRPVNIAMEIVGALPQEQQPSYYNVPITDPDLLAYLYMKDPLFAFFRGMYGFAAQDADIIIRAHAQAYQSGKVLNPPNPLPYKMAQKFRDAPHILGLLGFVRLAATDYEFEKATMWFWRNNPHMKPFQLFLYHEYTVVPYMVERLRDNAGPVPLPP